MVSRTHKTGYAVALLAAYVLFLQSLFASFAMAATVPLQPDNTAQAWIICSPSGTDISSKPDHNPLDVPPCCMALCGLSGLVLLPEHPSSPHLAAWSIEAAQSIISFAPEHSARRRGHPVHPQAPPALA